MIQREITRKRIQTKFSDFQCKLNDEITMPDSIRARHRLIDLMLALIAQIDPLQEKITP